MLMKLQIVSGAATVGLLALQGCSSDSGTQATKLGDSCETSDENACGGADSDFVCRDFGDDTYCTLPCEDGEVGQCGAGEQGGSGFECNAPTDGSGFCQKTEDPSGGGVAFGQSCQPDAMGRCGQGQATPSDFECEKNPTTEEYFCTQTCDGSKLGECGATSNPPSGYACDVDAGFCVPKDEVPTKPTVEWGEECGQMGGCGHGIEGYTPTLDCLAIPSGKSVCTQSCDGTKMGECGATSNPPSGFACDVDAGVCVPADEVPTGPTTQLGASCTPGSMGVCGAGTASGTTFECKTDSRKNESYCTEKCRRNAVGTCGNGQEGSTGEFECRQGYCYKV